MFYMRSNGYNKPKTPSVISEMTRMSKDKVNSSMQDHTQTTSRMLSSRKNSRKSSLKRLEFTNQGEIDLKQQISATKAYKIALKKPTTLYKITAPVSGSKKKNSIEVSNIIEVSVSGPHRPKTSMISIAKKKNLTLSKDFHNSKKATDGIHKIINANIMNRDG